MLSRIPPAPPVSPRLRLVLALAIVCACALIAVLSVQLSQRLRALQEAPTDNLHWNVTQLELDAVRLENAILSATTTPEQGLNDVRLRFDLLFSRAQTVDRGTMLEHLGMADAAGPLVARILVYLSQNVALIDSPDATLLAGLDQLRQDTVALRGDLRAMAIKVIEANAARQDTRRSELAAAIRKTALAGGALILLLFLMLGLVLRLNLQATSRAAEILRISNRLQATVATSLDAVVVADTHGRIMEFNPAAERVFGYSRAEAVGQTIGQLIVPDRHVVAHEAGMQRMRETGVKRVVDQGRIEMTARSRSGDEFPAELSITSAEGPEGTIFIGFLRDITEARAAQSALIDARDKATEAERTKTDLIAVMSHEMRTPLNGIMATLDIIGQGKLDDRQARLLAVAQESSRQLLRHVSDALDLSRIEAGQVPIQREPTDLAALLATLIEPLRPQAAARGTTIVLHLPRHLPIVMGDPLRLGQIVQNLVTNAVKFTEGGTITITLATNSLPGGVHQVDLTVRDTGIGIAVADQARIFDEFVMVDPSYGRKFGGTGLGLAISRRLARAMGGDIAVASTPGEGSTFTVTLPMPVSTDDTQRARPDDRGVSALDRPLSVLVVEDNATNRLVLEEMLQLLGHSVDHAANGGEGVSRAQSRRYDLILMDLSMPQVDGWTAAALIRAEGASRDSRILAVTAHARVHEDPRFAASGFDGLLTKPLSFQDLTSALVPAPKTQQPDRPAPETLDPDRLHELQGLGPDVCRRLIDQARIDLSRCRSAAGAGDPEARAATLHQAAGVAAVIGAKPLHAQLQQAEAALRAGNPNAMDIALAPLDALWDDTDHALLALLEKRPVAPPALSHPSPPAPV